MEILLFVIITPRLVSKCDFKKKKEKKKKGYVGDKNLFPSCFLCYVTDVILFYVTENAHIRIHHHFAGIDHGLPCARSTGKNLQLFIIFIR